MGYPGGRGSFVGPPSPSSASLSRGRAASSAPESPRLRDAFHTSATSSRFAQRVAAPSRSPSPSLSSPGPVESRYCDSEGGYESRHMMGNCMESSGVGWLLFINMESVLLVSGLVLFCLGLVLMIFYRVHFLEVVAVEFIILPVLMAVGGIFFMLTAMFGFYASRRDNSCVMITYACLLLPCFIITVAIIASGIRLVFIIKTGLYDGDVIPELSIYETNGWVRYKWDTLQSK